MLPSKDDEVHVTSSIHNTFPNEHNEELRGGNADVNLSWKEQAMLDLTPSIHRNTLVESCFAVAVPILLTMRQLLRCSHL